MSDVQFEDGNSNNSFKSRSVLGAPEVPGMANFLLKKGVIKEEGNAKYVLFFCIFFCIGLTVFIFVRFMPKETQYEKIKPYHRELPHSSS